MKLPDYLDKLFFCAGISAGIPSFFKLLYRTKLFSFHRNSTSTNTNASTNYYLNLPAGSTDIRLRNFSGDIDMFYEVFWRRTYALPVVPGTAGVIVDLGANIGMTVQWWAGLFPHASILAVEPDPLNIELLKHNTQHLSSCRWVQAAIGNKDGTAFISRSRFAYNTSVGDAGMLEVKQVSMPTLMQQYGLQTIDLLKIDIEGSEKLLLSSDTGWLSAVKYIVMEVHDGCEIVVDILLANGFVRANGSGSGAGLYFFSRLQEGV